MRILNFKSLSETIIIIIIIINYTDISKQIKKIKIQLKMLKLKYKNLIQNINDTKITPVSIPQNVKKNYKTTYAYF